MSNAVSNFFPGLGERHALSSRESLGYSLHEPQVSTGLAYFCQAERNPEIKKRRCVTALKAMLPEETESGSLLESIGTAKHFKVSNESPVHNSRQRIDWIIEWRSEQNERSCVAVEIKFDHIVTVGQLASYRLEARRRVNQEKKLYRLVLLTPDGNHHNRNNEWRPLSWLNFLRRWEHELQLAGEQSAAFATFRRQLWEMIGA